MNETLCHQDGHAGHHLCRWSTVEGTVSYGIRTGETPKQICCDISRVVSHLAVGASASRTLSRVRPSPSTVSCRASMAAAAQLALSYLT